MAKTKKKVMQITRERALKLFSYFNYKTAGKWSSKRMGGKLANLPEMVDVAKVKNDRVKAILKEIAGASSIEVVSATPEKKTNTKSTKKKKAAKKKTTAESVSKEKETKKQKKTGLDKFGSRKGTIQARINAVLTKRPKTMQQILDDAEVDNPQSGHLNNLIKAKHIVKSEKGFALK